MSHAAPATLARILAHPLLMLLHHARGAWLLALSLLGWGALQGDFLLPLPNPAPAAHA